jgi:hypothetical protein
MSESDIAEAALGDAPVPSGRRILSDSIPASAWHHASDFDRELVTSGDSQFLRFRTYMDPMSENRIAPRHRVLKAGTIEFGGGAIDRAVRNFQGGIGRKQPSRNPGAIHIGSASCRFASALPRCLAQREANRRRVRFRSPRQHPNSCSKGCKPPPASISTPQDDGSRLSSSRFLVAFCPMDPDEGASVWRRKRKRKGFVRPTTTDRAPVYRSTRVFCGLQKLSADSLPASRPDLQPPPMTTSHGHYRDRFFSYGFIYSARLNR